MPHHTTDRRSRPKTGMRASNEPPTFAHGPVSRGTSSACAHTGPAAGGPTRRLRTFWSVALRRARQELMELYKY